jgi:polyisoprenoid-binding protein YceI
MKLRIIPIAIVCMLFTLSTGNAGTGFNLSTKGTKSITLNNKVGANQAQFSSKAPLENIDGGTAVVSGTFALDLGNLEATTGKVFVAINTMQTGIALRDRHLQEKDWLDSESNPNITFDIKKLSSVQIVSSAGGKGVAKANAEGVFTLHGVGKAITVPIEITYIEKAPNDLVMIKVGDFPVSLKEHGVVGRKGIVGSKVSETITIKAMLYGSAN